ncbi:MAG: glycoside hydrolase family 9 protein [Spirochaetales bacterium]|nr:glycoside hydrolase family 9 protein [Spirochaetales bacterium]
MSVVLLTLTACVSTPSVPETAETPFMRDDVNIGFVSPEILTLTCETGKAVPGKQVPYEPEPGDRVDKIGTTRALMRNGRYLGTLAGKKQDILFLADSFIPTPFKPELGMQTGRYIIQSVADNDFSEGLMPAAVYRKSRPVGIARTENWKFELPARHTFYLVFPVPFKEKTRYTLSCPYGLFPEMAFTYDPENSFSEAVHVSQVGFRPDDPVKSAFLSCWMGSGKGLAYADGLPFKILEDSSGREVYNGKIALSRKADEPEDGYKGNYNKTNVYAMDFNDVAMPGIYRVYVKGVGCSFPFEIGPDAWKKAFITNTRGFYHQRSGMELGPPYTSYKRPRPFHPDDGVIVYASRTGLMETGNGLNTEDSNFGNLVKGATNETVDNAWGGYMDAGDWDRRIQHLEVTRLLLELYDLFPAYFNKINLNIPESSNTLPDVLDEALFNLDCYRRMQTADGGIRGGIESEEHPRHGETSWQESLRIFAYAPDPWSSYIYAGVAAHCSRVLKKSFPGLSGTYEKSAVRAFEWAEKTIAEKNIEEKYRAGIRDARNLAAADLFLLTGGEKYNSIFLSTTVFTKPGQDLFIWQKHEQRHAAWIYKRAEWPSVDKNIQYFCLSALRKEADERVASSQKAGFRWAKFTWQPPAFGAFAAADGLTMARVYYLTGEKKYLIALINACQNGAGANPMNICYTTGVGKRWPANPLHVDSRTSCQEPPAGLTIFGPMDYTIASAPGTKWSLDIAAPYAFPDVREWPGQESYWDIFWFPAECEFTVQEPMARNAYIWGFLSARK